MSPGGGTHSARRAVTFACLVGAAAVSMVGCAAFAGPPEEATGNRVNDQLRPDTHLGTSVVDLDATIPGEWDRVPIVCYGATDEDFASMLGFEWRPRPAVSSTGFASMLVFADEDRVVTSFSTGQDDSWVNVPYFTMCPLADEREPFPLLVELERSRSQVRFELRRDPADPDFDRWYVSGNTLSMLEAGISRPTSRDWSQTRADPTRRAGGVGGGVLGEGLGELDRPCRSSGKLDSTSC